MIQKREGGGREVIRKKEEVGRVEGGERMKRGSKGGCWVAVWIK